MTTSAPAHRYPRQRAAHHLACATCTAFRCHPEYFYCAFDAADFPAMCGRYRSHAEERLITLTPITEDNGGGENYA